MSERVYVFGECLPRTNPVLLWICRVCDFPVICQNEGFQITAIADHTKTCARESRPQ